MERTAFHDRKSRKEGNVTEREKGSRGRFMRLGILVVSFGTTYPKTRAKNIGKIAECVRECYPDALVKEAVSSNIVRTIMRKQEHLPALTITEALEQMKQEGITKAVVLPTHIIDGIENHKMKQAVEECRMLFDEIKVADALLTTEEDYAAAASALWESLKDEAGDCPVILMGHGTAHEADESYRKIERAITGYSHKRVYLATVEGGITIEDVIARMKKEVPAGSRVIVTPFMLVAGDHANNDMAGEEESFASRLREEGYEPECILRGLGEYAAIREIYLGHLRKALTDGGKPEGDAQNGGVLYGIGVGPGDPELLTLQAVRTIKSCDVIVLPAVSRENCYAYRIAASVIPELAHKEAACMPFPMIRDAEKLELAHTRIYETIRDYMDQGKTVGFLTIGDPSVYSTYMYMHHRATEEGRQAVMISGIPSFCAAAARLGISLGEKQEEIHIIPGSYDIEETLAYHGTRVYMKSGKKLAELLLALKQDGYSKDYEVYAVSNCGMENEKICDGVENIETDSGYLTTVIVKEK